MPAYCVATTAPLRCPVEQYVSHCLALLPAGTEAWYGGIPHLVVRRQRPHFAQPDPLPLTDSTRLPPVHKVADR